MSDKTLKADNIQHNQQRVNKRSMT